jgi:D-alanyl-D-alanine carboxypeptidase
VSPGAKWEYSNTGYIVLARVLGAITERPLERAFRAFVRPARSPRPRDERAATMRRSRRAFRRIARGYSVRDGVVQDNFEGADRIPTDLYGLPFGDGAFAGTALGAAEFLDALLVRGRLLRSPTVRRMLKRTPQSEAAGTSYGMGVEREVVAGRRWRGHLGSYAGFSTLGFTDRKRGVSLVVVANREVEGEQLPAQGIWRALARAYTRATS